MQNLRTRLATAMLVSAAFLFAVSAPALGTPGVFTPEWTTWGVDGGGHHQAATAMAVGIAAARGATWVDGAIAVDRSVYPDTVFHDNIDHNANWWGSYPSYYNSSWGNRFGNPQGKVQAYYNAAVAALRRGDRVEASKNIGYMAHYFEDVNGPLHTEESRLEDSALHTNLERDAGMTNLSSYIVNDGYQYRGDPAGFTVACATASHEYYASLVNNYAAHGFNSTVRDIEGVNLNRAVNGLADLIQSAQYDADSVTAVIDSVSPSMITTGTDVSFTGHGVDPAHAITGWKWRSNRDGALSTASTFTTSTLTVGIHNIYLSVRCSGPKWSAEAFRPIVVGAQGTKPRAVYRFFNVNTGVHFYTASEAERQNVQTTLASTYRLEGIGYALDTSSTLNVAPLYRFFDYTRGVHFLTADEAEKTNLQTNLTNVYRYDGIVAYVSKTNAPGNGTIYRFYNFRKGVHFYTASLAERDMVIARLGETYRYEGPAYYYDPPW